MIHESIVLRDTILDEIVPVALTAVLKYLLLLKLQEKL